MRPRSTELHRPSPATDGIPWEARLHTASPARALVACVLGAIVLALFAARDLPSWAERHAASSLVDAITPQLTRWDDELSRAGLASVHDGLRAAVGWAASLRWDKNADE